MEKPIFSASILAANFAALGKDVQRVLDAGVDFIHCDVMDHHFVPNLSFGSVVFQSLRHVGIHAPIDVHLMVEHPEDFIVPCSQAKVNLLTFHPETVSDVGHMIKQVRAASMSVGVAVNPEQPVMMVSKWLKHIDFVLMMSVHPGFGGQTFIPSTLKKLNQMRDLIEQRNDRVVLGVDGGIKVDNIAAASQAGAHFFVVGSGLLGASDYRERMKTFHDLLI